MREEGHYKILCLFHWIKFLKALLYFIHDIHVNIKGEKCVK